MSKSWIACWRKQKNYGMRSKNITFIIFITVITIILTPALAEAFTMSNQNYIIQMGDFVSGGGKASNANTSLDITLGQTGPGLYSGTNYKVRAGFQYIHFATRFAFTISETLIDFGTLSPTNPVTRTNTLTVSNSSPHGYSVTASENHPLTTSQNASIPDTTCDNGTCTQDASAAWTSTLTYGFGYRCDNVLGSDCNNGFTDTTYFKQFPDTSKSEPETSVMTGTGVGRNKKTQITYKVNISGTQTAGVYSNAITYIATPTF